jgi:hypothetical protein
VQVTVALWIVTVRGATIALSAIPCSPLDIVGSYVRGASVCTVMIPVP